MNITDKVSHEPCLGLMRQPFLPIQPSPAAAANARSASGVESTQTR
jgi:hypothetical protein